MLPRRPLLPIVALLSPLIVGCGGRALLSSLIPNNCALATQGPWQLNNGVAQADLFVGDSRLATALGLQRFRVWSKSCIFGLATLSFLGSQLGFHFGADS